MTDPLDHGAIKRELKQRERIKDEGVDRPTPLRAIPRRGSPLPLAPPPPKEGTTPTIGSPTVPGKLSLQDAAGSLQAQCGILTHRVEELSIIAESAVQHYYTGEPCICCGFTQESGQGHASDCAVAAYTLSRLAARGIHPSD